MDLVLDMFDDHLLDAAWSKVMPVHIPVNDILNTNNATLSYLKPTSTLVQAAATALAHKAAQHDFDAEAFITVSAWPRDDWRRQFISLSVITIIGIHLMYFTIAGASYRWLYDHRMMQHPRFLKGQVKMEIKTSLTAFPWLTLLTVPWFLGEARGWSMCYKSVDESPLGGGFWGWAYMAFSAALFLWFTDLGIYFIHRWEHVPIIYKHIHKPHHKWVIPTPFASHAFHPLDGYVQSLPYHMAIYIFPIHRLAFLGLFVFVNLWTIAIHDSDMITDHPLETVINGPAHHTLHHLYFTCNYGQYFTWADRYYNSYRQPAKGDDPLLAILANAQKTSVKDRELAKRQSDELAAALAKANGSAASEQDKKDQ